MVTIHPETSRISSNLGIAVISFDFASVFTCPSTIFISDAHALTIWIASLPFALSCDLLNVFPSIEITSFGSRDFIDSIQLRNALRNASVSILIKTRRNVSWEGIPLGSSRNVFSHSYFDSPYCAIWSHVSAPQIAAHIEITSISRRLCLLCLSRRGQ